MPIKIMSIPKDLNAAAPFPKIFASKVMMRRIIRSHVRPYNRTDHGSFVLSFRLTIFRNYTPAFHEIFIFIQNIAGLGCDTLPQVGWPPGTIFEHIYVPFTAACEAELSLLGLRRQQVLRLFENPNGSDRG